MKTQHIILAVMSLLLVACGQDNKPIFDVEAPDITILSPTDGATFEPGASILLKVDISENLELHEYSAVLRGSSGDIAITIDAGHSHDKKLSIEKEFVMPDLEDATFDLTVKANDHEDNLGSSTIQIFTSN